MCIRVSLKCPGFTRYAYQPSSRNCWCCPAGTYRRAGVNVYTLEVDDITSKGAGTQVTTTTPTAPIGFYMKDGAWVPCVDPPSGYYYTSHGGNRSDSCPTANCDNAKVGERYTGFNRTKNECEVATCPEAPNGYYFDQRGNCILSVCTNGKDGFYYTSDGLTLGSCTSKPCSNAIPGKYYIGSSVGSNNCPLGGCPDARTGFYFKQTGSCAQTACPDPPIGHYYRGSNCSYAEHKTCLAGQWTASAGNSTTDTECLTCGNGRFRVAAPTSKAREVSEAEACSGVHKNCSAGEWTEAAGTSTRDTQCTGRVANLQTRCHCPMLLNFVHEDLMLFGMFSPDFYPCCQKCVDCNVMKVISYRSACEVSRCEVGWSVSQDKTKCDANQCLCPNGTASSGANCTSHGATRCANCDTGFYIDDASGSCTGMCMKCGSANGAAGIN